VSKTLFGILILTLQAAHLIFDYLHRKKYIDEGRAKAIHEHTKKINKVVSDYSKLVASPDDIPDSVLQDRNKPK